MVFLRPSTNLDSFVVALDCVCRLQLLDAIQILKKRHLPLVLANKIVSNNLSKHFFSPC